MKKKGLLISTIVMVVVLIAALTTSTYAWITSSQKTTIEGFDVKVVASNAVNIGVKADNTHIDPNSVNNNLFLHGDVTWVNTTVGQLGADAGSWTGGTTGLSAVLNHNIKWGEQSKSVGAINAASGTDVETMTDATKYGYIGGSDGKANTASSNVTYINAANLDKGTTLKSVTAAYANNKYTSGNTSGDAQSGDYAYLFLGASPAETLTSNELVIMVDGNNGEGSSVGILASLRVAYRLTKSDDDAVDTQWKEVEFFKNNNFGDPLSEAKVTWTDAEKVAYKTAFNEEAPSTGVGVVTIPNLTCVQGKIDQIELVIYMAGPDDDCIDAGKGTSGKIKMFFATTSATKTTAPTSATIGADGKLTLKGVNDATVEVQIGNGSWTEVKGTWAASGTEYTFTSTDVVSGVSAGSVVKVRVKTPDKAYSTEVAVTNNKT